MRSLKLTESDIWFWDYLSVAHAKTHPVQPYPSLGGVFSWKPFDISQCSRLCSLPINSFPWKYPRLLPAHPVQWGSRSANPQGFYSEGGGEDLLTDISWWGTLFRIFHFNLSTHKKRSLFPRLQRDKSIHFHLTITGKVQNFHACGGLETVGVQLKWHILKSYEFWLNQPDRKGYPFAFLKSGSAQIIN